MDGNNMNNNYSEYSYEANGTYEVVEQKSNALAIVSLVTGILSIVCCCVPIASWITGAAGIVCGVLGMKRCEKIGMARIGMILGIVGVVLGFIMFIINLVLTFSGEGLDSYYYY
ncbi:MAG: DUF4190 domain-containing protein [Lachnospiraceae bacterium]|nr:DUF4190 domain-containing protein [Lachnospiraceae bacterium]